MGRSTPDGPRGARPAPPPAPPRPRYEPGAIVDVAPRERRARCSYCGRGGPELTQCEGCGATVPEASSRPRPAFPANRVIREGFGGFDELAKKLEELDASGRVLLERLAPLPPAFPKVKR